MGLRCAGTVVRRSGLVGGRGFVRAAWACGAGMWSIKRPLKKVSVALGMDGVSLVFRTVAWLRWKTTAPHCLAIYRTARRFILICRVGEGWNVKGIVMSGRDLYIVELRLRLGGGFGGASGVFSTQRFH